MARHGHRHHDRLRIFRTRDGRAAAGPALLTFVAWLLGGVLAFAGALVSPSGDAPSKAGGKYVYAREAFGPRIGSWSAGARDSRCTGAIARSAW